MDIKEENYDKFIFKAPLAIELYCDLNDIDSTLEGEIKNMYSKLEEYREKNMKEKSEIVNILKDIIKSIGYDKFIAYDDGDIEYNCKLKEGK